MLLQTSCNNGDSYLSQSSSMLQLCQTLLCLYDFVSKTCFPHIAQTPAIRKYSGTSKILPRKRSNIVHKSIKDRPYKQVGEKLRSRYLSCMNKTGSTLLPGEAAACRLCILISHKEHTFTHTKKISTGAL